MPVLPHCLRYEARQHAVDTAYVHLLLERSTYGTIDKVLVFAPLLFLSVLITRQLLVW